MPVLCSVLRLHLDYRVSPFFYFLKFFLKKKKKGLFKEIVAEKFPNLGRDVDIDVQVVQRTPKMIITMITMRSIIIIMLKVKEKNSENSKRKTTHHI